MILFLHSRRSFKIVVIELIKYLTRINSIKGRRILLGWRYYRCHCILQLYAGSEMAETLKTPRNSFLNSCVASLSGRMNKVSGAVIMSGLVSTRTRTRDNLEEIISSGDCSPL